MDTNHHELDRVLSQFSLWGTNQRESFSDEQTRLFLKEVHRAWCFSGSSMDDLIHRSSAENCETEDRISALLGLAQMHYYGLAAHPTKSQWVKVNKKRAFQCWLEAANAGSHAAQGAVHKFGCGGHPVDVRKAFHHWSIAASEGHVPSMSFLGLMYDKGEGVEKDEKKSLELWTIAASAGYPPASNNLAVMYELGDGVPRDVDKAIALYKSSALHGHPTAICNLGLLMLVCHEKTTRYIKSERVKLNARTSSNAGAWLVSDEDNLGEEYQLEKYIEELTFDPKVHLEEFNRAVSLAILEPAKSTRQKHMPVRDAIGVEEMMVEEIEEMTEEDHDEEIEEVVEWKHEDEDEDVWSQWSDKSFYPLVTSMFAVSSALLDENALYNLGLFFADGRGVKSDLASAVVLYEIAAELGHRDAMYNLGVILHNGADDVDADESRAHAYFQRAAELGEPTSLGFLGYIYRHGNASLAITPDMAVAKTYFTRGAELGDAYSMYNLAQMSDEEGREKEVLSWFTKAAKAGDARAHLDLAAIYELGVRSIPSSPTLCVEHLSKSVAWQVPEVLSRVKDSLREKFIATLFTTTFCSSMLEKIQVIMTFHKNCSLHLLLLDSMEAMNHTVDESSDGPHALESFQTLFAHVHAHRRGDNKGCRDGHAMDGSVLADFARAVKDVRWNVDGLATNAIRQVVLEHTNAYRRLNDVRTSFLLGRLCCPPTATIECPIGALPMEVIYLILDHVTLSSWMESPSS